MYPHCAGIVFCSQLLPYIIVGVNGCDDGYGVLLHYCIGYGAQPAYVLAPVGRCKAKVFLLLFVLRLHSFFVHAQRAAAANR